MVSSLGFKESYYDDIYKGEVVFLENLPKKEPWIDFHKQYLDAHKGKESFTVGFIGALRYLPCIFQLIEAVEKLSPEVPVNVLFAGGSYPEDLKVIKSHITKPHLFRFIGPYVYGDEVAGLYSQIDLIYCVYDSTIHNCRIAMPNKFYEAIITKIPIIVSSNTFLASEVKRYGIGVSVESGNEDELAELLLLALNNDSWYAKAQQSLETLDYNDLYTSYENALHRALM